LKKKSRTIKKELKQARWVRLTASGAVLLPVTLLVISFGCCLIGIYLFYEGTQAEIYIPFFIGVSVAMSGSAIWSLYSTISAVEYAALRPARTVTFLVTYKTGRMTEEIKVGKQSVLNVGANPDDDVENFLLELNFPPETEVVNAPEYLAATLQPDWGPYPKYTKLSYEKSFARKKLFHGISFSVISHQIGNYKIPVRLSAKGITDFKAELTLNVVP
jgi:hypothetical protein